MFQPFILPGCIFRFFGAGVFFGHAVMCFRYHEGFRFWGGGGWLVESHEGDGKRFGVATSDIIVMAVQRA